MSGYNRQADISCRYCDRKYVYHDSMERHVREKHGSKYERDAIREARRWYAEQRKQRLRAEKQRDLQNCVIAWALRWARAPIEPEARQLKAACAALERFEAKDQTK